MTDSRIGPARRRAAAAKVVLGAGGLVAFALAMGFARVSQSGHPKHHLQSLSAPPRFLAVVRSDQLQAGILGPASAPPDATSGVS
jgi:hypothetical protein